MAAVFVEKRAFLDFERHFLKNLSDSFEILIPTHANYGHWWRVCVSLRLNRSKGVPWGGDPPPQGCEIGISHVNLKKKKIKIINVLFVLGDYKQKKIIFFVVKIKRRLDHFQAFFPSLTQGYDRWVPQAKRLEL